MSDPIQTKKPRKKNIKEGDILVVEQKDYIEVSPNKAKKMLPKRERSEKQKMNDERLRQKQKEKKILSDQEKQKQKELEKKTLEESNKIKIKVLPKRVKKPKVLEENLPVENQKLPLQGRITESKETRGIPKTESDSDTSEDEEIQQLKKHVKKVSIKKQLYDQINNIKEETMRSRTPDRQPQGGYYDNIVNRMFR
jgi:hypothetical protein